MTSTTHSSGHQRLGDFQIERELGRGGMGIVYEARQVSLNRRVALKVLSGGLGLTPKAIQRFHREAEAAAKLHHTNIVPVYSTGEHDGTHFYAMELIEGPSLDHVIRQMGATVSSAEPKPYASTDRIGLSPKLAQTGPYIEGSTAAGSTAGLSSSSTGRENGYCDKVARTIAEVADALEYAHRQGVIHRDIKPSNLLLSPGGRLSVNDFGLARMLEQPGMTMTGEIIGTPAYMSPEQITAGRTPLDHRTDIYSLGATLYEMLTLHPPFKGERRDQVLAQILNKEPIAPRKVNPNVPVDLETICLKAMERDPDRRYQTAGVMAEDLRRYVNRFAISARRAGPGERLGMWVRRHPGLAAAVGLAVVASMLTGFIVFQSWQNRQERNAAEGTARQKLLTEKKQHAESLIFSGQFPEAKVTIQEAEELGVEEEWAQWRRGQIAFHSGEVEKAIPLLERAGASMPDCQAANWLLGAAYFSAGDWQRGVHIGTHFGSLAPNTPEDGLYKGLYQAWDFPEEGLKTLDDALPRQPVLIAHVVRAHVLAGLAIDTSEISYIMRARDDVIAAKSIQRGNALVIAEDLYVHHIAAILYEEKNQTKEHNEALIIAQGDADALKALPDVPVAVWTRGVFLEDQGRMDEAFQCYEMAMQQNQVGPMVARNFAWLLYERDRVAQARDVVKGYLPAGYVRDGSLVLMIAKTSGDFREAENICNSMSGASTDGFIFYRCLLYNFLGLKIRAGAVLAEFPGNFDQYSPEYAAMARERLDLVRAPSLLTAEKLLERDPRSRRKRVRWHLWIGIMRLGDGDRAGARKHFELAVEAREPYQTSFAPSRAFLKRMQQDETWPPWIK
ncbi:MAG: protein kinase domain-containing protein [Gemmataceae bacterium]